MRAIVLGLLLVGAIGRADPPPSKDRRMAFVRVSVLMPAGIVWHRESQRRIHMEWPGANAPWGDLDSVGESRSSRDNPWKAAETLWRGDRPRVLKENPGCRIGSAAWRSLGPNRAFCATAKSPHRASILIAYVVVGEHVVKLVLVGPVPGRPVDPRAVPAFRRLASSLRELPTTKRRSS